MTTPKMGRPSAETELWDWLTKEHKRTGVVPPPIEAERQGVAAKRTAMRWYAAWVEAGRLKRPYNQAWTMGRAIEMIEMIETIESYGEWASGMCAAETAEEWLGAGFSASEADVWLDAGFWRAAAAHRAKAGGVDPHQCLDEDAQAFCNGDISLDDLTR